MKSKHQNIIIKTPGPTVIKLFESENDLNCKNGCHDLIETLCLFSYNCSNSQRYFAEI